mmetsp:Transcript_34527/g.31226  ORF Transcript_34527/g.31226 Transcript_34527/m.31226 type:complete len:223 (+) Transcript_34527:169-837(+)
MTSSFHGDALSILSWLSSINSDNPVLTGESFLKSSQFKSFVSDFRLSQGIISSTSSITLSNLIKSVVAELVHQAVKHGISGILIDSVLASAIVVFFFDMGEHTTTNSDHPKEFVDIITRVMRVSTKDDEDVVDVESLADLKGVFFITSHGHTNSSDVTVVPSVVIDEDCSVGETSDLISVIPPRHNLGIVLGVSSQPVVGLSKIINDDLVTHSVSAGKNNRW